MYKTVDLRVEKTYLALFNAFTVLIEEKRFEEFTVNELCEKAMIRRTTFYKHFADKLDYFDFYLKEIKNQFKENLTETDGENDIKAYFIFMCRSLINFLTEHRAMVNGIIASNMIPLLLDILIDTIKSDLIATYKKQNVSQEEIEVFEYKASFYTGGLLTMLYETIKKQKEIDEEKFIEIFSSLLSEL